MNVRERSPLPSSGCVVVTVAVVVGAVVVFMIRDQAREFVPVGDCGKHRVR